MPLRRFWLMHNNINRISAERDMRLLSLKVASNSTEAEGINEYRRRLVLEIGHVAKVEERLDKAGLERLAALAG